jgi:hypothetical protein
LTAAVEARRKRRRRNGIEKAALIRLPRPMLLRPQCAVRGARTGWRERRLAAVLTSLAGLVPFQVAFVARDLERAVSKFDALLGAGPWQGHVFDAGSVEGREYHGQPADWSIRLVVNDRQPQFEFIEPLAGPNI